MLIIAINVPVVETSQTLYKQSINYMWWNGRMCLFTRPYAWCYSSAL